MLDIIIGSYAEWLNENPDFLLPAINYIMASLNEPGLSSSAATAFKDVCELCRNHLVNIVENMVNAYLSLGSHVQVKSFKALLRVILVRQYKRLKWPARS